MLAQFVMRQHNDCFWDDWNDPRAAWGYRVAKEFINPEVLPNWKEAFTQVVITQGATRTIYISGQVAVDKDKHLIGDGDVRAQAL
jgi:enamine deaminase RidA (YjgF/YER057c/UK114 family)